MWLHRVQQLLFIILLEFFDGCSLLFTTIVSMTAGVCVCVCVCVGWHRDSHVTCFQCRQFYYNTNHSLLFDAITRIRQFLSRRYFFELTIMFDGNAAGLLGTNCEKGHTARVMRFCCLFYFSPFILFYFNLLYKYMFLYISNEIQICLATDLQIKLIV